MIFNVTICYIDTIVYPIKVQLYMQLIAMYNAMNVHCSCVVALFMHYIVTIGRYHQNKDCRQGVFYENDIRLYFLRSFKKFLKCFNFDTNLLP